MPIMKRKVKFFKERNNKISLAKKWEAKFMKEVKKNEL